MFLYYLDLLDIGFGVFLAFAGAVTSALLLGIAFHEFCHAFTSSRLGDQTARRLGRVTLNPLAHLDPIGTFLLFFVGFGWGKPVPVNAYALRLEPRFGMGVVAAAGPLSNLAVAAAMALPIRLGWVPWHSPFAVSQFEVSTWSASDYVGLFLSAAVLLNLILAVFNFLPLAPLDGYRLWTGVLPIELARPLVRMERYGMLVLFGLFLIGPVFGIYLFAWVVEPVVDALARGLTGTS